MDDAAYCLPLSKSKSKSMPPTTPTRRELWFACLLNGIVERTTDNTLANVQYQWSNSTLQSIPSELHSLLPTWQGSSSLPAPKSSGPAEVEAEEHRRNQQQELELQQERLWKEYAQLMSWDLVAVRDLEPDEVLVVYQPENMPSAISTRETESSETGSDSDSETVGL
mmetsp:Transcript_30166/g.71087  ORF Transcript_30166/g.71087 Transcript_30166/m.71087 type:complete len:167 (-) Transcript_30166:74-574(-)